MDMEHILPMMIIQVRLYCDDHFHYITRPNTEVSYITSDIFD